MDTIAHLLFAYILFGGGINDIFIVLLLSNLPDIVTIPLRIYDNFIKDGGRNLHDLFFWNPTKRYLQLYRTSHSLLFCFIFGGILSIFTKNYLLLSAYVMSHIIGDVFTHRGVWSTRLFYPFSNFHIEFYNWSYWEKPLINIVLYLMMIFIFVLRTI